MHLSFQFVCSLTLSLVLSLFTYVNMYHIHLALWISVNMVSARFSAIMYCILSDVLYQKKGGGKLV